VVDRINTPPRAEFRRRFVNYPGASWRPGMPTRAKSRIPNARLARNPLGQKAQHG
jgi:hypothetical protein